MGFTLITHFDDRGYRAINAALECVSNEKLCRVPYGRVNENERFLVDTLPFHFTISSSNETQNHIFDKMRDFSFDSFCVMIDGLGIMKGRNNSYVLFFTMSMSLMMDELRRKVHKRIGNDSYLPYNHINHITICITTDFEEVIRVKKEIESGFSPFPLTIISIGLYRIWPGKLISIY